MSIPVQSTGTGHKRQGATVVAGRARFLVLTSTLLRLEYAADGCFEDRATFNVLTRDGQLPPYETHEADGCIEIRTEHLVLRYALGSGPFGANNVQVILTAGDKQVRAVPDWTVSTAGTVGRRLEAEDADFYNCSAWNLDRPDCSGHGCVAMGEHPDATVQFTIFSVEREDNYVLHLRYSTPRPASAALALGVNGAVAGRVRLPSTGDGWATATSKVRLRAGTNTVALSNDSTESGTVWVDYVAITEAGEPDPAAGEPQADPANLGGWVRAVDNEDGPIALKPGLLSRDGWFLLNDSYTAVWPDDSWPLPRQHVGPYQDGYFFGYGHDYRRGLCELAMITGSAPLLPKWAFGPWYSKYERYDHDDYRAIVERFRAEQIPLDVLVVDTDYKSPDPWNGWNWDPVLFPDPEAFLRWLADQGLHASLNVHPSIDTGDPRYNETRSTAGGDLLHGERHGQPRRTFDWANPRHVRAYFDLHEPFERQGVDFWWLDWCNDDSRVLTPGLPGDAWINHLYADRLAQQGARGFVLSRFGGALKGYGNRMVEEPAGPWADHRSVVPFDGDTHSTWDVMGFQPRYFTSICSVGVPYMSHVVGGFKSKHLAEDMYARWVQLGAFMPVMWLHSNLQPSADRLPWQYAEGGDVARTFLRLREALVPHLYTLAREAYDTGVPITRALYLHYPEHDEAYDFDREYLLGSDVLVAPILEPGMEASTDVWFPPGRWTDFFTGETVEGPCVRTVTAPLERMPVYLKAGGMVTLAPPMRHVGERPADPLIVVIAPGADGRFTLYEDEGEGLGFRDGAYATTVLVHRSAVERASLTVTAQEGDYPGRLPHRSYELRFLAVNRPQVVVVGGDQLTEGDRTDGWSYDSQTRTLTVAVGTRSTGEPVFVTHDGGAAS